MYRDLPTSAPQGLELNKDMHHKMSHFQPSHILTGNSILYTHVLQSDILVNKTQLAPQWFPKITWSC